MKRFAGVLVLFVLFTAELLLYSRVDTGIFVVTTILALAIGVVSTIHFFGPEEGYK
jgi:hypothetical protein